AVRPPSGCNQTQIPLQTKDGQLLGLGLHVDGQSSRGPVPGHVRGVHVIGVQAGRRSLPSSSGAGDVRPWLAAFPGGKARLRGFVLGASVSVDAMMVDVEDEGNPFGMAEGDRKSVV